MPKYKPAAFRWEGPDMNLRGELGDYVFRDTRGRLFPCKPGEVGPTMATFIP